MADFKPRPGTFLPYMESANRSRLGKIAPASPLTLLEILSNNPQQSLPMFGLQTRSGMEPSRYEASEQSIQLTGKGAEVTRLSRPA